MSDEDSSPWWGRHHKNYASLVGAKLVRSTKHQRQPSSPPPPPSSSSSSSTSTSSPAAASATPIFPRHGIKLSYLPKFIYEHGGPLNFMFVSTTTVVEKVIKPETKAANSSYCEMLLAQGNPYDAVGVATIFVSHAMYECQFVDLVDALIEYFAGKGEEGEDSNPYIWFNIFNMNQNLAAKLNYEYYSKTFFQGVASIQKTVMVMGGPLTNPTPLTRAWCLFEIYCTVANSRPFDVAVSPLMQQVYVNFVLTRGIRSCIDDMIRFINLETATSFKPEDREQIFAVVRQTVGFARVNKIVLDAFRPAVVAAIRAGIAREPDARKSIALKNDLAVYHESISQYDEAEELLMDVLAAQKELLGDGVPDVLGTLNNLASIYFKQHRYAQAEVTFDDCITKMKALLGDKEPHTLRAMNSLALVYTAEGKYVEAEAMLIFVMEAKKNFPPPNVTIGDLADLYRLQGRYDLAEPLARDHLQSMRLWYHDRDPHTLAAMQLLAGVCLGQGKDEEAEPLFKDCLAKSRELLGEKDDTTKQALNGLAALYEKQGRKHDASALRNEFGR